MRIATMCTQDEEKGGLVLETIMRVATKLKECKIEGRAGVCQLFTMSAPGNCLGGPKGIPGKLCA